MKPTTTPIPYFTAIDEIRKEMINQFHELVKQITKGYWSPEHNTREDRYVDMRAVEIGHYDHYFKKEVLFELDLETAELKVCFALQPNNQKALWLTQAIQSPTRHEIVFVVVTEETEQGLTALVDDYFRRGFEAIKDVFSFEIVQVAVA